MSQPPADSRQPRQRSGDKGKAEWAHVQSARAEYLRLSDELECVVRTPKLFGSIAMEHPDGVQYIDNLGKQLTSAIEKYRMSIRNYVRALDPSPQQASESSSAFELTSREREVLALVARGISSKDIARELGIRFKTVMCHRSRIMSKLSAHNAADLTRAAIRMGLVEP